MQKAKGFTLIELLVVVAIIGLLASIVLVSLNSARLKARNSRRNADIRQLAIAFNMAADANGSYPDTSSTWVCVSQGCYGAWAALSSLPAVDAALAPYIKKPADPTGGRGYGGYVYDSNFSNVSPYVPQGAYLSWMLEPGGTCSIGILWGSSADFIQCLLKVD